MIKKPFLLFLYFISVFCAYSQVKVIHYFDKNQTRVKEILFYTSKADKILDGKYMRLYENGKKELIGKFEKGRKEGLFIEYHINGQKKAEVNYVKDKKTGNFSTYFQSGLLKQKGTLRRDSILDTLYTYYESGILESKGFFKKDRLNGKLFQYFQSGNLKSDADYKNNKPNGITLNFYEDGRSIFNKINMLDGKPNGLFQSFYQSGVLETECLYKNALKNGYFKNYNSKSVLIQESNYNMGDLDGKAVSYYDQGSIKGNFYYHKGKKLGNYVIFYLSGTKKEEVTIDNNPGVILLNKTLYHENGTAQLKSVYQNDKKSGTWKYFSNIGKDSIVENYFKGKLSGERLIFNIETEKIQSKINYYNGNKMGLCYFYYPNGILKMESSYNRDDLHGLTKEYNETGNKIAEGFYFLNTKHGNWTTYIEGKTKDQTLIYKRGELVKQIPYVETVTKSRSSQNFKSKKNKVK